MKGDRMEKGLKGYRPLLLLLLCGGMTFEGCRTGGDYRPSQHRPEHTDRGKYRCNGETGDGIGEQTPDRPGLCPEGVRHRQTRTDVHGPDRPAEPVEQQLPQDAGRGGEDGHEGAAGHHFGRAGRGGEQRRHHLP